MKKLLIALTLVLAFPILASAVEAENGTIYSINGYGHFGNHQGLGGDIGVTFNIIPENDLSPIVFFSVGAGALDQNLYFDMNLLGGVSWHATNFFYADLAGGVKGFIQLGDDTQLGGSFVVDATVLLHIAEIIGIRGGCSFSYGTNGAILSPHVGIASVFDFSWLFN